MIIVNASKRLIASEVDAIEVHQMTGSPSDSKANSNLLGNAHAAIRAIADEDAQVHLQSQDLFGVQYVIKAQAGMHSLLIDASTAKKLVSILSKGEYSIEISVDAGKLVVDFYDEAE
jgi:hypothetical protein